MYVLSWSCFAREDRLYAFAADSVKVLGLERWAKSKVVELDGFGGADSRALSQLRQVLEAQGFRVCAPADKATVASCRRDEDSVLMIEGRIESLKAFHAIVSLTWMEAGRGGNYRYGFWWNGLSWSRDTTKDERGDLVILTQSNYGINAPVLPVTRLASARRAPVRPARYAWRWADSRSSEETT
jgi:hypothetical protein